MPARTEAELARKEDLVGRSLAGSSVSGTDAGVDLPRPRAGLMSSGDSWPRPRGDQPSRLLEPDSWRRPWRRWPGRDDEVRGNPRPLFDEPRPGVAVPARTEAELARKEDLVGRSLAGSSVSGTDAGVDLPRPRAGLMSSGDSWPRPRGDQPSRLLEPDSWRRPWRRWPGRDDDVVLQSGDPRTASPSEARSDLA